MCVIEGKGEGKREGDAGLGALIHKRTEVVQNADDCKS